MRSINMWEVKFLQRVTPDVTFQYDGIPHHVIELLQPWLSDGRTTAIKDAADA
jgi:hypothetical protein